jgi:hypothetical protein
MSLFTLSPSVQSAITGLTIAEKRALLVDLKADISWAVQSARTSKELLKADKRVAAELRREAAIAKAREKLDKLLSKPVGSKAVKVNRKPSKPTVFQVEAREANEIAKKLAAKKVV